MSKFQKFFTARLAIIKEYNSQLEAKEKKVNIIVGEYNEKVEKLRQELKIDWKEFDKWCKETDNDCSESEDDCSDSEDEEHL